MESGERSNLKAKERLLHTPTGVRNDRQKCYNFMLDLSVDAGVCK